MKIFWAARSWNLLLWIEAALGTTLLTPAYGERVLFDSLSLPLSLSLSLSKSITISLSYDYVLLTITSPMQTITKYSSSKPWLLPTMFWNVKFNCQRVLNICFLLAVVLYGPAWAGVGLFDCATYKAVLIASLRWDCAALCACGGTPVE
jgi:hypothetical protein